MLYILKQLFKSVYKKRKVIFIVTILCFLLCSIAFLYSSEMFYRIAYSDSDVYYSVNTKGKTYGEIKKYLANFDDGFLYDAYILLFDGEVSCPIKSDYQVLYGTKPKNETEILVGNFDGAENAVGNYIEFFGKNLMVVGVCTVDCVFLIPLSLLPDNAIIEEIRIRSLNFNGTNRINKLLESAFPNCEIEKVGKLSFTEDFLSNPITLLLIAMDSLSAAGLVLCVVYLLNSASDFLRVCKIQGMTDSKCADLYVYFLLILILCVAIVSDIIYKILSVTVLKDVGISLSVAQYSLNIFEMFLINIITTGVIMLVFLPFLGITNKKQIEVRENV